jgi:NADPH-dependent glutamate synthase beta subunit-like oxidoreductase
VALDCARVLASSWTSFIETDISERALDSLSKSQIRSITILGRRGPLQAAFTIKELRELNNIPTSSLFLDFNDFNLQEATVSPPKKRLFQFLKKVSESYECSAHQRAVPIKFGFSPTALIGDQNGRLSFVQVEKNQLGTDYDQVHGTGNFHTIPCNLLITAIGFKGVPINGLPFDKATCTIPNRRGRVTTDSSGSQLVEGLYVTGWAKRSARGIGA